MNTALNKAFRLTGGQTGLARLLGTSRQRVHNWAVRGSVPLGWIIEIQRVTNGKVTVADFISAEEN
jgi:DNA-binding transcriptional regulator YdaS (Cro superfamily)